MDNNSNLTAKNFILAKDILDSEGNIIMTKDSLLTKELYSKLQSKYKGKIYVKIRRSGSTDVLVNSIYNNPEFLLFNENYQEVTQKIKEALIDIGNGAVIDLKKLSNLTNSIMDNIKCKRDILTYLAYLEISDEAVYTHSNNVALLCKLFSDWLNLDEEKSTYLTSAGILHDIGKTKVDQAVLYKAGKLSPEEFEEVKRHAEYGYEILKDREEIPEEIKLATLMHHEKIDGTGYPTGAKGDELSDYAKIVAICDIYDAMTANRVYRNKLTPFEVMKNFETNCYGQLDTKYLLFFLKNIAYSYIGCNVLLSNGNVGSIVFINTNDLSRPMVKIGNDIVNLSLTKNLNITSVM